MKAIKQDWHAGFDSEHNMGKVWQGNRHLQGTIDPYTQIR